MTELAIKKDEAPMSLADRWNKLKKDVPSLRARDAAETLEVSEAQLVAARCGEDVKRLAGPWGSLIEELPSLGPVMALTRNDTVVHEKTGVFGNISIHGAMGLVLNDDIDLRILLNNWASGYALEEVTAHGLRKSLQFFDTSGTAVHKIYLVENSDHEAYRTLVQKYLDSDQSRVQMVTVPSAPAPDADDSEIDTDLLRKQWLALRDVHDFMVLLKKLNVGRLQAMRLIGEDMAYQVTSDSFQNGLEIAAETGLPIMIFVGSPGVIQIHSGTVQTLKQVGPWFNVLDEGFNLHLRTDQIASAWVVRKPTKDGIITSLEIFDSENQQMALMFGVRKEGERERADWRALIETFDWVK
ncbi:MAG: hemin-degrading factor [Rhodospirillaceae bacterium]|nr:hemin-degrading factor [Rhodospirillaceae bacterium]|tara:strand:+ start:7218 stop:8282 length:1065 start_codon:yes stop_codon:yes gene_type:complete